MQRNSRHSSNFSLEMLYNKVSLFFSLDIPRGNSYQYLGFNLFVIATLIYSIEVLEHGLACRGKREAIHSF